MAGLPILLATALFLSLFNNIHAAHRCGRLPSEYTAPRSSSAGKFRLRIHGNPESYIPDVNYTVTIEGESYIHQTQRFTEFNLVVESEGHGFDAGRFELRDLAQTKFSENCRNMIKQTTKAYKERVSVQWTAPSSGNGCVTFRTTVIVRKDTWFQDDEPLTKTLCEDHQKVFDEQPSVLEECSACSEATYEVTFEGLWSRHTHPNNFPQDLFQTRFSKLIGAAHNKYYRLWEYEQQATDGFKEVAENGDITALEAELKTQGSNIRTIIRAPGIGHPDITKKTFATFRTTPEHHLMSLVSMIVPSPDWIVGVSKLELCLLNGSWVDKRTLNLYPWDAGTDSGTTYESPDDPTLPRDIIRRITSDTPNTPFYDETGEQMKPLARLQVVRLNLFEKSCEDIKIDGESEENKRSIEEEGEEGEGGEKGRDYCSVTSWSEWTECSFDCDTKVGYRSRHRQHKVFPWISEGCNKTLVDMQKCYVENNNCWDPNKCSVTSWTDWSSCYQNHGPECHYRRRYRHITGNGECKNAQNKPTLMETDICEGNQPDCKIENPDELIQRDPSKNCKIEASECNVTCGQGFKEVKLVKIEGYDDSTECDNQPNLVPCDTGIPCTEESSTLFPNMEIGNQEKSSDNGYESISQNPVIDCVTSRWSDWSTCSATCGKSYKQRSRKIMTYPQNGGKPCPKKLFKRKRCHVPSCDAETDSKEDPDSDTYFTKNGCKYSEWTPWSECTVTCGEGKKQKARLVIDKEPGAVCDQRTKTKICIRPACRQHSL